MSPNGLGSNQKTIVAAAILIIIFTVLSLLGLAFCINELDSFNVNQKVTWDNKEQIILKPSPPWFWYNKNDGQLIAIRRIDSDSKKQLLELTAFNSPGYIGYQAAIDELSFLTNNASKPSTLFILLTAGLSAIIGVQIRTIFNFIGKVCYKKDLDIKAWWPWYVMRPLLGFLLGILLIVLLGAQFLSINVSYDDSDIYWYGITMLAGFGVEDLFLRLRLLTKTIFGVEK